MKDFFNLLAKMLAGAGILVVLMLIGLVVLLVSRAAFILCALVFLFLLVMILAFFIHRIIK